MQMTLTPVPTAAPQASSQKSEASKATKNNSELAANQPEYLPDSVIDGGAGAGASAAQKAPVVNVFGEFNRSHKASRAVLADLSLKQHTFLEAGYDADVCLDPAGQTLLFSSDRDGERTQLFSQRVDSPAVTQLTREAADNAQPCFSPDGKLIVFSSNRNGLWHLYAMKPDGRNVVQITDGPSNDMHPSFSPDGMRLVYSTLAVNTAEAVAAEQWQLCVVDLLSRQKSLIGPGLFPAWSPQKGRDVIAFQKTRAKGSRWFSLWTCELHNSEAGTLEASNVTEVAVSANAALVSPTWSPDGRQLAFVSIIEPAQTRNGKPQGQQDVWVIGADGTERRRLTDGTAMNLTPCWSVDNRVYFVSDRSGHECIWSLNSATPGSAAPSSSAASDPTELKP